MLEEDLNRQTIFVELRLARSDLPPSFIPDPPKIILCSRFASILSLFLLPLSAIKETKLALAAPKVYLVRSSSFRLTDLLISRRLNPIVLRIDLDFEEPDSFSKNQIVPLVYSPVLSNIFC